MQATVVILGFLKGQIYSLLYTSDRDVVSIYFCHFKIYFALQYTVRTFTESREGIFSSLPIVSCYSYITIIGFVIPFLHLQVFTIIYTQA